ncbi:unnamed protein product [Clonostachys chloroleuca]|uniref:Uncharacterized protein n=1 Tax=Clonostachys chloroleuca TaxID=1926264 RepID=A0AA35M6Q7_9HYPO|nr:unnamed protein product [Clonostachys chloroleuca]
MSIVSSHHDIDISIKATAYFITSSHKALNRIAVGFINAETTGHPSPKQVATFYTEERLEDYILKNPEPRTLKGLLWKALKMQCLLAMNIAGMALDYVLLYNAVVFA